MSAARCVLEVLDSHGELLSRTRIETLPVTIGRGYACDLIVDDPFMDPVHIRIIEEGAALVAEDVGSTNGLRANGSNERAARIVLERGTTLHAGRTTIRYLEPGEPVAAARRDRQAAWNAPLSKPSLLNSRLARAAAILGCLIVVALHKSQTFFEPGVTGKTVSETIAVLLLLALWAGMWAGAARLARHPALFSHHLAIASVSVAVLVILFYGNDVFTFLWPGSIMDAGFGIVFVVVLVVTMYAELGLASSLRRWWRWGAAVVLPLATLGLIELTIHADEKKFSTKMSYQEQLAPVPAHLVPAISIDEFAKALSKAKEAVDKEMSEGAKKK